MKPLNIDFRFALKTGEAIESFLSKGHFEDTFLEKCIRNIENGFRTLISGNGPGNHFLGWLSLPEENISMVEEMMVRAKDFSQKSEVLVCIGIGGSYLGAKAIYEALKPQLSEKIEGFPKIIFAGHHLGEDYMSELIPILDKKEYTLCVISKSGTTTEPAVAFRILRNHIERKYGKKEAAKRIVAITDRAKGALKTLSDKEGYATYVVPDNVGGRYSVLSPVGLFPLAVAGVDIRQLLEGSAEMQKKLFTRELDWKSNIAAQYALFRNYLYTIEGKKIELLVNYDARLTYMSEWWKQLYGESEGKDHKGIYPCSANFTTDLHSLGQYIQEGERTFLETVLSISRQNTSLEIPSDPENLDGMNFVAGKRISYVNAKAEEGTCMAHAFEGSVPILRIEIPELTAYFLGQLVYFFEFACGISGYALGINPFDQPGVEAYKKNMFKLLGK